MIRQWLSVYVATVLALAFRTAMAAPEGESPRVPDLIQFTATKATFSTPTPMRVYADGVLYDTVTFRDVRKVPIAFDTSGDPSARALSADGRYFAAQKSSTKPVSLALWDTSTGQEVRTLDVIPSPLSVTWT